MCVDAAYMANMMQAHSPITLALCIVVVFVIASSLGTSLIKQLCMASLRTNESLVVHRYRCKWEHVICGKMGSS